MPPDSKNSIAEALTHSFGQFTTFIDSLADTQFDHLPEGKWSAGQHLEHLVLSVKPVNFALSLPTWLLRLLFGKRKNRNSRSFTEVVSKYKSVLANGAKATGAYIPKPVPAAKKEKLLKTYNTHLKQLLQHLQHLTDQQLDNLLLPHPLLGKMTIREVLFFTIYHTEHHLQSLQNRAETP